MAQDNPQLDTLVIDCIGAMIAVTDREGKLIRFNLGGQRMMGYEAHEVLGRLIWEVFPPPEYRERTKQRFQQLMSGAALQIDAVWLTKSGEAKHLSCYCSGVRGPGGEVEYTIGTGVDVTARVAAEQALRVSEERFRTTFDNAAIGMALANEEGRYLHANRAFCQLIGYTEEELQKLTILSITHPEDRPRNQAIYDSIFRNKVRSYVLEKRYIRRDGTEVWVQVSASIASEGDGRPSTLIGLFENISERKATQEKLEKAYADLRLLNDTLEQRVNQRTAELQARTEELDRSKQTLVEQSGILQSILDSMGDGVVVADGTGKLVLINPAAIRLSGSVDSGPNQIEERAARPWFYRADGKTRYLAEEMPIMRSARGEAVDDAEVLIRRPGYPETWTSATSRPILDASKKPAGAVVVVRDVSERKRHEAELEEANASLRESEKHYKELADSHLRLAREVEHRVRNNLQGLLGLVSLMRDRATDVRSFAEAMESRLGAMQHVHQLLAQMRWKGVGMRSLIDGALATLKHMACFPIEMHISGPDIFIGPRQLLPLTLVIVEWFTNSCKYGAHSLAGGRLDIHWETVGDTVPQRVRLAWTERGGPAIAGPVVPSVGTDLVLGFIRRGLSGEVELRYPAQGADHVMEFTVRNDAVALSESRSGRCGAVESDP